MARALERHAKGEAKVIPIIIRRVHWTDAPFSHLQLLPTNAKPVKSWTDQDEAFYDIVVGIERAIQDLLRSRPVFQRAPAVISQSLVTLHTFQGHTDYVYHVAFSPNSQWLASASADSTVRLWNPQTGQPLHTLQGHTGNVWHVAFSPNSQWLASGWPVPTLTAPFGCGDSQSNDYYSNKYSNPHKQAKIKTNNNKI
jgi:WD40 repeat protein